MRTLPRRARAVRAWVLFAALVVALHPERAAAQQVTIYRDRFGVPSIVANRLPDAMFGLGYAMASDNAVQMARNFKQARGRRAEVDGLPNMLTDTFLRSLGFEERAIKASTSLPAEPALLIRRFCDGANRALAGQKAHLPDWIEPFTPVDVLALAQLGQAAFPLQEISNQLLPGIGSNQFAVAPSRSGTGHAILSMDPHLLWSGPLLWYEYSLYAGADHFHGITLSGLPFGSMGHTDHVAWSMTNNNPRLYDFLTVTVNPSNRKQYSFHGEWRDFEEVPLEMKYRENGQVKTRKQTVSRTAWGPMVPFRAHAVRLAIPSIPVMLEQSLRMMRARSAREFRQALMLRGLSMWNIVYADTLGHIGYQYNANLPRRSEAFDWTKPVSGADPGTKWGEFWSLDALPHAEDPASGILVNSNSSPWLTTLGHEIPTTGWPAYVTSYGVTTRYERLAALLSANPHITPDTAKSIATDTLVPYARSAATSLAAAVRQTEASPAHQAGRSALTAPARATGNTTVTDLKADANAPAPTLADPADAVRMRDALRILAAWNGRADIEAKGCGFYLYWMRADREMAALARKSARGEPWSASEQEAAVAALRKALGEMLAHYGRLETSWGALHVSVRGGRPQPVSGFGYVTPGDGTAAVTPNFGPFRDGRIVCDGGSSFRMIVHLDPKGVQSWSILPYGNSQDPANPHYADQQAMFGRGEYKDTLYGLHRIRASAVSHITLPTN